MITCPKCEASVCVKDGMARGNCAISVPSVSIRTLSDTAAKAPRSNERPWSSTWKDLGSARSVVCSTVVMWRCTPGSRPTGNPLKRSGQRPASGSSKWMDYIRRLGRKKRLLALGGCRLVRKAIPPWRTGCPRYRHWPAIMEYCEGRYLPSRHE